MNDRLIGARKGKKGDDGFSATGNFLKAVEDVQSSIDTVRTSIKTVEDKHNDALSSINAEAAKAACAAAEKLMGDISKTANQIKDRIKQLKTEAGKSNISASEVTIRQNQADTVSKNFIEVMKEYQAVQESYNLKFRRNVERQVKIVKPNATRRDIESFLESGDMEQIFGSQSLQSQAGRQTAAARTAYAEISEKNREIRNIESSLKELNQMFMDFAMLVDQQQSSIDSVQVNVDSSVSDVKKGIEEIKTARNYQSKARKKMCLIIFIIIVIIGVILGPVLATTLNKT